MTSIKLTVNGEHHEIDVKPHWSLLHVLRKKIGVNGVKYGCGTGECGACTVILDGKLIHSCLKLAAQCNESEITTVEGISMGPRLTALQEALVQHGAVQCGYCMPGVVLAAHVLLEENPRPTVQDVREALSGNFCRCTGYQKIVAAIADTSSKR